MPRTGALVLCLACLAALALPAHAGAAFRAKTSLVASNGALRVVVKLTSTTRLTASSRPRVVKVRRGTKTYTLARVRGTRAAVAAGTWRSALYRGRSAVALAGLLGKSVKVLVTTAAGIRTINSTVARPTGPAPPNPPAPNPLPPAPPAGPTGMFEAPGRDLNGEEARPFLERYFVNSRFTDCPGAGWPNCSVEQRYNHCPDGSWEYHRYTPSSGSDINSYGSMQVTAAKVNADGSWIVDYVQTAYGYSHTYHWEIATNGRVLGTYDGNETLGPLQYQQPANCGSY